MTHLHRSGGGSGATRRLGWVLALSLTYAAAEVLGGLLANSLALLADAGHMLTDIMALSLALFAAWCARRPPDDARTYGYQRLEILAALFNGVTLIVIALIIFHEAWQRIRTPPDVGWGLMASIAAGGLLVNVIAMLILRGQLHGLNMRAAYLHVLGDMLGSAGALIAALLIGTLGWTLADPLASLAIGGIIIFSAVRLVFDAAHVLLEGAPSHLRTEEVRECLSRLDGVGDVHDLHLWSLGGSAPLLTAHLVLDHSIDGATVLREATSVLDRRFGITHVTLQIEPPDFNIIQTLTSADEGSA